MRHLSGQWSTRPGKHTKSELEAMAIEIVDDYPLIA